MARELEFKTKIVFEDNIKSLQKAIDRLSVEGYSLVSSNVNFDKDGFCAVIMQKLKNT